MKVTARGFSELSKRLANGKTLVTRNITTALRNSVTIVQLAAQNTVPTGATGGLKRSISTQVDERRLIGVVGLDFPGSVYGVYVEKGSKPHWVPIAALKRWADQRGISPYAVQKSIARKGTKAHPFMRPAYENNRSFIQRQFKNALDGTIKSLNGK